MDADVEVGAVIMRAFLIARAEGVSRFYYYSWTNPYGWSLSDSNGVAKPGTKYWQKVFDLMLDREVLACDLRDPNFSCDLRDKMGGVITVRWTDSGALARREGPSLSPAGPEALPR